MIALQLSGKKDLRLLLVMQYDALVLFAKSLYFFE
tara:strand:+ start:442 stop:546 length:105 start_codon:yes stop_codon:yes gene_type:complete